MTKIARKNGDMTRKLIMKSAASCFSKQGFSGTSMQQIADKAKINQALLYHHFKNKKNLWKQVKKYYVAQSDLHPIPDCPSPSLKLTLTHIIEQRLKLYTEHPQLIRMILWQQLEPNSEDLLGGSHASPDQWLTTLEALQKHNKIKSSVNTEMIMIWLSSSLYAPALAKSLFPKKDPAKLKAYKIMLLEQFERILRP